MYIFKLFVLFLCSIVLLLSQKQALEELKQTVQQLRCSEAKFAAQKELLEQKVQENDGKEPPPVVNYEEDARSVTSMVSFTSVLLNCAALLFYFSPGIKVSSYSQRWLKWINFTLHLWRLGLEKQFSCVIFFFKVAITCNTLCMSVNLVWSSVHLMLKFSLDCFIVESVNP